MGMKLLNLVLMLFLVAGMGSSAVYAEEKNGSSADSGKSLFVYSGAGLKAPMQEIGWLFENQTGIKVDITYAGSGALISQMNLTHKGDLFIPGGTADFQNAKKRGLVTGDPELLAYHIPVIVVQKGNPKNIQSLKDLATPGLKVALGDFNATAIGRSSDQMFAKLNITDDVAKNVVVRTSTVNEIATAMISSQVDAAVITHDMVNKDKMDMIEIPVSDNSILIIPIGVTSFSNDPDTASAFVKFVSSDAGKKIFVDHGFTAYPDPKYAEVVA